MAKYKLSNIAKEDLIRIHQYGVHRFGMQKADDYFNAFFEYFDIIAREPLAFESVDFIKEGYRRCVCGIDTIYYKINNNKIEIMTIIGKRDLDNVF